MHHAACGNELIHRQLINVNITPHTAHTHTHTHITHISHTHTDPPDFTEEPSATVAMGDTSSLSWTVQDEGESLITILMALYSILLTFFLECKPLEKVQPALQSYIHCI